MRTLAALRGLDWARIGRDALDTGAAAIADGLRRRLPEDAPAEAIRHDAEGDDRASISTRDAALARAELGLASSPPRPFLTPTPRDREDMAAAVARRVREALS